MMSWRDIRRSLRPPPGLHRRHQAFARRRWPGLAPSIEVLIAARGFQGIGAALVNVASPALVSATFSDPQARARAIGIWTGIAAVGLAIGPTLGGVLTENVGWRSIFLLNPVIGIIAVVLTLGFVSESRDSASRSFDVPGQLLFITGIGVLTYALIQGGHDGWLSPVILSSFAVAAVVLVVFVRYELRASDPMTTRFRIVRTTLPSTPPLPRSSASTGRCSSSRSTSRTSVATVREDGPPAARDDDPDDHPVPADRTDRRGARRTHSHADWTRQPDNRDRHSRRSDARLLVVTLVALAFLGTAAGTAVAAATTEAMGSIPPERSGMASGILSSQRGPRLDGRVRDHGQRLRRRSRSRFRATSNPTFPMARSDSRLSIGSSMTRIPTPLPA